MRYKLLGRSGLRVSELCLGTMTFGEEWGFGADREESRRQFDTFVERGGNFIDTANLYTDGTSERFVGEFIAAERERIVLATKYTLAMRDGDPNAAGNHRKNLVQSVEASLKRLQTDYIDLLWVHAWDGMTPVEETMRALDDLVRAGKVLYLGISDTPAWVVAQANTLAALRGWTPFVALQIEYSLIQRTPERDLLPMAKALDLAVTPWGAIGGGILSGKYSRDGAAADATRQAGNESQGRLTERNLTIADEVVRIAGDIGGKPTQVALAWVRQQPGVIIPILGARTTAQLEDNLRVLDLTLSPEHLQQLDAVSRIELGFPQEFLNRPNIREVVNSDVVARIDNHRA